MLIIPCSKTLRAVRPITDESRERLRRVFLPVNIPHMIIFKYNTTHHNSSRRMSTTTDVPLSMINHTLTC